MIKAVKKAIKEVKTICTDSLRRICVENSWYTCGDNEAYSNMFQRIYKKKEKYSNELCYLTAVDIINHSDDLEGRYGLEGDELAAEIMQEIYINCIMVSFEIEEA